MPRSTSNLPHVLIIRAQDIDWSGSHWTLRSFHSDDLRKYGNDLESDDWDSLSAAVDANARAP